jgi:2-polyprenyl-3-methyl-5-hydroxy-6-metoxy-1,4-benzoquinol methylase
MGKEQDCVYYNAIFESSTSYKQGYKHSHYFPGWQKAVEWLKRSNKADMKIMDVGCGPGQFAEMLKDNSFTSYYGFDFSEVAIDIAKKRIPEWISQFQTADIFSSGLLESSAYDAICIFEVLEHLDNDIDCLSLIKSGTTVILSVPNFWDPAHVRIFDSVADAIARYDGIVDIQDTFEMTRAPAKWFYLYGIKK